MTFNSFGFFVFFPLVAALYLSLPYRFRKAFLLLAGYYFYMLFKPGYVLILIASTLIDYYLGLKIDGAPSQNKRKTLFILGIIHNIALLGSFKFLNFFNLTGILVPVGISYYVFKKLSYLIDVYRETLKPEKYIVQFALYVSFFPEIMAGPIDRAGKLVPQFSREVGFDYHRVTDGLKLMAWGFFKKIIIADRLAVFVDKVYNQPTHFEGLSLVVATVYFSIQVYCDFSGYTDIALGAGKVMGFDLMENFNRPYFSTSIGEFWKRWHISLSSWLMDYLFLPVAYSISRKIKRPELLHIKAETWAYMTGIMTAMIICGFWHGAGWTFIIWGAIHGFYLAFSFATKKIRRKLNKKLKINKRSTMANLARGFITFGMVTFAWIFFRANTLSDAVYIVTHLFTGWAKAFDINGLLEAIHFGLLKKELAVAGVSILVLLIVDMLRREQTFSRWISERKTIMRWGFYLILLVWILTFSDTGAENFIYFKF